MSRTFRRCVCLLVSENSVPVFLEFVGKFLGRKASRKGLWVALVVIREVGDEQALAIALIENIQRENLNPLEEAQAIRRLLDEFGYTHERAAQAIGRSRSATTNLLRLLNLAEPVQTMLLAGDIEMGHARCLLPLDKAEQILLAHPDHSYQG